MLSTLTSVPLGAAPSAAASAPSIWGFLAGSAVVGIGLYLVLGGLIYMHFYLRRQAQAARWKCQPDRWPSPSMRSYDLRLGMFNITLGSLLSGGLAYFIAAGRLRHGAYLQLGDRGLLWALASGVVYFLTVDVLLYWAHRLYHRPALFRAIHRFHHRNTTPTPFTAFSMHPIEFLTYESVSLLPLLFLPVYAPVAIAVLVYSDLMALIQHSGVRIRVPLPGVPVSLFHDDHHRHFHVNYGQNLALWDRLFGTLRRHGRRYGVEVFGGQGVPQQQDQGPSPVVDYFHR